MTKEQRLTEKIETLKQQLDYVESNNNDFMRRLRNILNISPLGVYSDESIIEEIQKLKDKILVKDGEMIEKDKTIETLNRLVRVALKDETLRERYEVNTDFTGFNKETDKMFRDGKVVTIYRKFAEFNI